MRACFLGQNVCALGFGVATLQTPRPSEPAEDAGSPIPAADPAPWTAGQAFFRLYPAPAPPAHMKDR